jgi:hypothetical protein
MEKCPHCFEKVPKHLIIAIGLKVYSAIIWKFDGFYIKYMKAHSLTRNYFSQYLSLVDTNWVQWDHLWSPNCS